MINDSGCNRKPSQAVLLFERRDRFQPAGPMGHHAVDGGLTPGNSPAVEGQGVQSAVEKPQISIEGLGGAAGGWFLGGVVPCLRRRDGAAVGHRVRVGHLGGDCTAKGQDAAQPLGAGEVDSDAQVFPRLESGEKLIGFSSGKRGGAVCQEQMATLALQAGQMGQNRHIRFVQRNPGAEGFQGAAARKVLWGVAENGEMGVFTWQRLPLGGGVVEAVGSERGQTVQVGGGCRLEGGLVPQPSIAAISRPIQQN